MKTKCIRLLAALGFLLICWHCWASPVPQVVNRIVAWGDLNYDVTLNTSSPSGNQSGLSQIAAGDFHSLALQNDGSIVAWGDDTFGQINLPDQIQNRPAIQIAAGNIHSLALLPDGTVVGWGPESGQYGDYGQCAVPSGLNQVVEIAAGAVHSLALRSDGTLSAWGSDLNGQCNIPYGLNQVVAIAGGITRWIQ